MPTSSPINSDEIARLMRERAWGQKDLADKSDCSPKTIKRTLTSGEASNRTRRQIAEAFGISAEKLLPEFETEQNPIPNEDPAHFSRNLPHEKFETVFAIPFRNELTGMLPLLFDVSLYELAHRAQQIDMVGLNLYVGWFGQNEFVEALSARKRTARVRIILPNRNAAFLDHHASERAHLINPNSFFEHYDATIGIIKAMSLMRSVRYTQDIAIHAGVVRFDDTIILTAYLPLHRGSNCPAFLFRAQTAIRTFETICKHVDDLWHAAQSSERRLRRPRATRQTKRP